MAGALLHWKKFTLMQTDFYLPEIHNFEKLHTKSNNIVESHVGYINEIINLIKENIKVKAPFMDVVDVLFWNSKTIHGSRKPK